jgi:hypothetical protein
MLRHVNNAGHVMYASLSLFILQHVSKPTVHVQQQPHHSNQHGQSPATMHVQIQNTSLQYMFMCLCAFMPLTYPPAHQSPALLMGLRNLGRWCVCLPLTA